MPDQSWMKGGPAYTTLARLYANGSDVTSHILKTTQMNQNSDSSQALKMHTATEYSEKKQTKIIDRSRPILLYVYSVIQT